MVGRRARVRISASCGIRFMVASWVTPPSHLSHPLQHVNKRLFIVEPLRRSLGKLAYGEVRLLLAGARLTEGYAPNLYHRRAQAGNIRPTAHLTLLLFVSCLDQEALVPSVRVCCPLLGFSNCKKSLQGRREQRILQKEDISSTFSRIRPEPLFEGPAPKVATLN